jgi:hypothetical protein
VLFFSAMASLRIPRVFAAAFLPLALALSACPQNPMQQNWPKYSSLVQGVLGDYDGAMTDVANIDLGLSAPTGGPKGGLQNITTAAAVDQLKTQVIPKLDAVAAKAAAIQTPSLPELTKYHLPLVQALQAKSDAYKTIVAGFDKKDAETFDQGLAKLSAADNALNQFRTSFNDAALSGEPPASLVPQH